MKTDKIGQQYLPILQTLCETYGYGAIMHDASKLWQEKDNKGALVVGTCAAFVVPCECETPYKCEWCCGSGWLTKHVKTVKDNQSR